MIDDIVDTKDIVKCCTNCGIERFEIDGEWGIVVEVRAVDRAELTEPFEMPFCDIDCYAEWVESDPTNPFDR